MSSVLYLKTVPSNTAINRTLSIIFNIYSYRAVLQCCLVPASPCVCREISAKSFSLHSVSHLTTPASGSSPCAPSSADARPASFIASLDPMSRLVFDINVTSSPSPRPIGHPTGRDFFVLFCGARLPLSPALFPGTSFRQSAHGGTPEDSDSRCFRDSATRSSECRHAARVTGGNTAPDGRNVPDGAGTSSTRREWPRLGA
jgi:hypothetical protein